MKIIVAGSRSIIDYGAVVKAVIDSGFSLSMVVSGGAKGADALGEKFATENNLQVKIFPADWKRYGRAAGPKRNKEMAEYADGLIAIWDGSSKGTKNMIREMEKLEKPVFVLHPES